MDVTIPSSVAFPPGPFPVIKEKKMEKIGSKISKLFFVPDLDIGVPNKTLNRNKPVFLEREVRAPQV